LIALAENIIIITCSIFFLQFGITARFYDDVSTQTRGKERYSGTVEKKARVTKEGVSSLRQRSREKKSVGDRDDFFAFFFWIKLGRIFGGKKYLKKNPKGERSCPLTKRETHF